MTRTGTYRPLIDHAIGSLGDLSSDITIFRRELHRVKDKMESDWTAEELVALYNSLVSIAFKCDSSLEEWEKQTGIYIPRPQKGGHHGEEES